MTSETRSLHGTPAAPGLARGPVYVLDAFEEAPVAGTTPRTPARTAAGETRSLREALSRACAELTRLQSTAADADARAILEFQLAMLEDESLAEPAFEAIDRGVPVNGAWLTTLDAQIADYEDSADEYFRARASDLRDIRDRVARALTGTVLAAIPAGSIVVAADLLPSHFLEIRWEGGGIALFEGSSSSHLATLARARGVPMIVQMARAALAPNDEALLDADAGLLIAAPDEEAVRLFDERFGTAQRTAATEQTFLTAPAATANGERVQVLLNVAQRSELDAISPAHCDGIGVVRTELMLDSLADLRDEERQYLAYREIVDWAQGKPVTFRTLDAGGDKPIEGYTLPDESNPYLGVRGVRLSLLHPEIATVQLRAFARVAVLGPVKIMVPMVTRPSEMDRMRELLTAAVRALRADGAACALPELGMMVEVPAAALTLDLFAADFLSIGSNDLIAYLTACGRDSDRLAALADPLAPAVLRTLEMIVRAARARTIDVSLCGDMASDERYLRPLLETGLRSFSVAPAALARVKATISTVGELPAPLPA